MAYPYLLGQGIDMEWRIVDHGAYPEYKKLPLGMSEQEAYRKFIEALGYVYNGQWEFDIQLNPQGKFPGILHIDLWHGNSHSASRIEPHIVTNYRDASAPFDISGFQTIALAISQGVVFYDLKSFRQIRPPSRAIRILRHRHRMEKNWQPLI